MWCGACGACASLLAACRCPLPAHCQPLPAIASPLPDCSQGKSPKFPAQNFPSTFRIFGWWWVWEVVFFFGRVAKASFGHAGKWSRGSGGGFQDPVAINCLTLQSLSSERYAMRGDAARGPWSPCPVAARTRPLVTLPSGQPCSHFGHQPCSYLVHQLLWSPMLQSPRSPTLCLPWSPSLQLPWSPTLWLPWSPARHHAMSWVCCSRRNLCLPALMQCTRH